METPIEILIEAALFFRGGSVSLKDIANDTGYSLEEVENGVRSLEMSLHGRGIRLVREGAHIALATAPETHELIEKMRREELEGPLGKAGLETLAIIIYRAPIARSDVEYIRGVNCSSILRSLLIRGLIERVEHDHDKRTFLYQPTAELPAYFGVSTITELPQYAEIKTMIESVFTERDSALENQEKLEAENV